MPTNRKGASTDVYVGAYIPPTLKQRLVTLQAQIQLKEKRPVTMQEVLKICFDYACETYMGSK